MIIRVRASNKRTSPNPDDTRERGGFLLLPKAIKHNDTYIVRWLERSTWLESCNYRYPNLARDMKGVHEHESKVEGHKMARHRGGGRRWIEQVKHSSR